MLREPKNIFEELPDLLTVDEFARYMRLNRNTAYEAVRSGRVPSVRLGKRGAIRIPKQAIERMLS